MAMIRTQNLQLKDDGAGAKAFLAQPDDDAKHPGVVLIQEWWGLEPHIKDLAQKLAVEGFITVVPDFYNGKVATEPNDAQKAVMMIRGNIDRAIDMVQGAVDYLKAQSNVDPKKVGIIGFCVGGLVTFLSAERIDGFAAVVPFYPGGYDPDPANVANVNAPILAFYGEHDGSVPMDTVAKIERVYKEAGKDYEARVYPAGHAFINPDHGMGDEESARDAWPRAVDFLRLHLQGVTA